MKVKQHIEELEKECAEIYARNLFGSINPADAKEFEKLKEEMETLKGALYE